MDDDLCHICRKPPARLSPLYRRTTCADCDETANIRHSPMRRRLIATIHGIAFAVGWLVFLPSAVVQGIREAHKSLDADKPD